MKIIKLTFIGIELSCLATVVLLAFNPSWAQENKLGYFYSAYLVGCTLCAIATQKEQQQIPWDDDEEQ